MASIILQQTAPVPNCQILLIFKSRKVLTQLIKSVFGTKKAPSIIPMLCYSEFIKYIFIYFCCKLFKLYQASNALVCFITQVISNCFTSLNIKFHIILCGKLMIKIISFRHRLEIIICLNIILSLATCQSSQKFQYSANDIIVVYPNETTELVFSLTTASDEYLSEADLQLNIVINQEKGNITYFNIIYFNYQSLNGQECYSDWVSQGQVSNTEPCQPLNNSNFNSSNDCINYTGCSSQIINYSMALKEQRMYQNYLLIQNTNLNQNLIVHTSMTLELTSNNLWFYLGVGLTCLLLISLVIFTGIVFYWSLKYKRVKKMFEQFKLTEDDKND